MSDETGASAIDPTPIESVVLIGFMAAGKTTVGRKLAKKLNWRFLDFDEEIVRRTGGSVARFFQSQGEPAFRELERRLTAELSSERRIVLAPGGGWATNPGVLEALPAWTTVVWLRISPEEAVRRSRRSRTRRPLLAGPGALARARQLLAEREATYRRADHVVDVQGRSANTIAAQIAALVRSQGSECQQPKNSD